MDGPHGVIGFVGCPVLVNKGFSCNPLPVSIGFRTSRWLETTHPETGGIMLQMIADKKVQAVLTGNCGPNAYQVLSPAGIMVITGVTGKVQDAVRDYKAGKYEASSQPSLSPHFGMGSGQGKEE